MPLGWLTGMFVGWLIGIGLGIEVGWFIGVGMILGGWFMGMEVAGFMGVEGTMDDGPWFIGLWD